MNERLRTHWLQYVALTAAALVFGGPLVVLVLSSFKTPEQLVEAPTELLPHPWRWQNYVDAVTAMPYARYLANSLLICLGSVVGTVLSCSLVAYGFSRLRWPGRDWVFGIVLATMLLPWHVTMIPKFLLLRELGLYDTLAALVIPTFLGDAFYIFLLRQFFMTIPEELSEAARLDGCSEFGIYWRIVMPLARPALATVALLRFIAAWNDFSGPLLYLSDPNRFPLAYGLVQFVSAYTSQTHLLLAASVLFTLPVILLFTFAQRWFVASMSTTGLKG